MNSRQQWRILTARSHRIAFSSVLNFFATRPMHFLAVRRTKLIEKWKYVFSVLFNFYIFRCARNGLCWEQNGSLRTSNLVRKQNTLPFSTSAAHNDTFGVVNKIKNNGISARECERAVASLKKFTSENLVFLYPSLKKTGVLHLPPQKIRKDPHHSTHTSKSKTIRSSNGSFKVDQVWKRMFYAVLMSWSAVHLQQVLQMTLLLDLHL
jgi:hypothetical protein